MGVVLLLAGTGKCFFHSIHTDSGAQPASCPIGSEATSSKGKANSSLSSTVVKDAWSFTSFSRAFNEQVQGNVHSNRDHDMKEILNNKPVRKFFGSLLAYQ
jgi:hypothetical protein